MPRVVRPATKPLPLIHPVAEVAQAVIEARHNAYDAAAKELFPNVEVAAPAIEVDVKHVPPTLKRFELNGHTIEVFDRYNVRLVKPDGTTEQFRSQAAAKRATIDLDKVMPQVAPDSPLLKSCMEHLIKFRPGANGTGSFFIMGNKGKIRDCNGGACHYNLCYGVGGYGDKTAETPALVATVWRGNKMKSKREGEELFTSWLSNDSPWSSCCITKEQPFITDFGSICDGENSTARMIAGFCIASRAGWEYPADIDHWVKLVQAGINGDMAFLLCRALTLDARGHYSYSGRNEHHFALDTNMDMEEATNFLHHHPANNNKQPYSKDTQYAGVCGMWSPSKANRKRSFILDMLERHRKEAITEIKPAWGPAVAGIAGLDLEGLVTVANKEYERIMNEKRA